MQRSVFMRLVSRRVPRQSHRIEFARACVRFFEKKREKNLEKDSTDASYLVDKTDATRRRGRGWTRSEFCAGGQSYDVYEFARQSSTSQSERTSSVLVSGSPFSRRATSRGWKKRKAGVSARRSIEPINLLAPPLPPSYPLTHSPVEQNSTNATMCCVCDVRCSVLVLT